MLHERSHFYNFKSFPMSSIIILKSIHSDCSTLTGKEVYLHRLNITTNIHTIHFLSELKITLKLLLSSIEAYMNKSSQIKCGM
jgi:hypothetical protein